MDVMQKTKARLLSLCIYNDIKKSAPIQYLMRLCSTKAPDAMLENYSNLIHSIWDSGFFTLTEYILWHLKYDDSFIGKAVAEGSVKKSIIDAAAMDIRQLSSVATLSFSDLKREIYNFCMSIDHEYGSIVQNMAELPQGNCFTDDEIFESYRKHGCGLFALGQEFHWEKGELRQVFHPDPIAPMDMIGYTQQREAVIANTKILISGQLANNVLLYGDSGTGKSATVKSLVNIPDFYNLRLIEIAKNSLEEITDLMRLVSNHTQKFILYIDDLSLEQDDKGFSSLKTALEGGLEQRPDNVAIYVTSNRRHMIKESFSERQGDDVHARETIEEYTSLSERFGLRIPYLSLDKNKYTDMVLELCHRRKLPYSDEVLRKEANHWELRHGSRTPRVVVQLVEKLAGDAQGI